VDDFVVSNAVKQSLVVKKVKHVLDGGRQNVASTRYTEQSLKKVIDIHLQRTLQTTDTARPFN